MGPLLADHSLNVFVKFASNSKMDAAGRKMVIENGIQPTELCVVIVPAFVRAINKELL